MSEKIFLDTDVILDVIFKREPHFIDSQKVISLVEKDYFCGCTSCLILANCYYIISNNKNQETALKAISKLRSILDVLPFTDKEIGESLSSDMKDFEDGIQYFICVNNNVNDLITRNITDFRDVEINVMTPKDFLNLKEIKKIIEGPDDNIE